MSDEAGCAEDTEDDKHQTDSEDSAHSAERPLPQSPTSRLSVKHVMEVIQSFDEYKRYLVKSIGFGGMLDLQLRQKLNLKFSAWTMSKVSTH